MESHTQLDPMKKHVAMRLDPVLLRRLDTLARVTGKSKTAIIEQALWEKLSNFDPTPALAELGELASSLKE